MFHPIKRKRFLLDTHRSFYSLDNYKLYRRILSQLYNDDKDLGSERAMQELGSED